MEISVEGSKKLKVSLAHDPAIPEELCQCAIEIPAQPCLTTKLFPIVNTEPA